MRTVLATLVTVLCAAAALPSSAGAAAPLVGIADQKVRMFSDPLFLGLGVGHARYVVPWDAMDGGFQKQELTSWLVNAKAVGVTPLLTFGHSRRDGRQRISPSPALLQRQFLRIRKAFPWVVEFSTWNEPNHCSQPVCRRPELAARYFDAMTRACPACTILGADVLDTPNMVDWITTFRKAAVNEPRAWALHNYVDANRFGTKGTRALLRATRGQVWLTETGGIVARRTKKKLPLPEGEAHAAAATRWLFDRLIPLSPRIKRVYVYHWNSNTATDGWDSALLRLDGKPRPAFRVIRSRLQRGAVAAKRQGPLTARAPAAAAAPG